MAHPKVESFIKILKEKTGIEVANFNGTHSDWKGNCRELAFHAGISSELRESIFSEIDKDQQSFEAVKWFDKEDKDRLYYYSYTQLLFHNNNEKLDKLIGKAPKGTKWKLTLEKVEE